MGKAVIIGSAKGGLLSPFVGNIGIYDLRVRDDAATHKIEYLSRTLTHLYGSVKKAITENLTIQIVAIIGGSTEHIVGSFTIPTSQPLAVPIEWSPADFAYNNFPHKSELRFDIKASDGSFDQDGIAEFLLIFSPSDTGSMAPSTSPGSVTNTSGSLIADQPVLGNGGTDVKSGSKSGTTNELMTATGSFTSGNFLNTDASGNAKDSGFDAADFDAAGAATAAAAAALASAEAADPVPASSTPLVESGSGAVGTSAKYAREDHAHPAPLAVVFNAANGGLSTGSDVVPLNPAPRSGSVSSGEVRVIESDPSTDLTFDITRGGVSVLSAAVTVAAGTAADTLSSFTLSSAPLAIAKHDIFKLAPSSITTAWRFTAQLED